MKISLIVRGAFVLLALAALSPVGEAYDAGAHGKAACWLLVAIVVLLIGDQIAKAANDSRK